MHSEVKHTMTQYKIRNKKRKKKSQYGPFSHINTDLKEVSPVSLFRGVTRVPATSSFPTLAVF